MGRAVRLQCETTPPNFLPAHVQTRLPIDVVQGTTVELHAHIRTTQVHDGQADLFALVNGDDGLQEGTLEERAPAGTTSWTPYVLTVDVPNAATGVTIGMTLTGSGIADFAGLRVVVNGQPLPQEAPSPPTPTSADLDWLRERAVALDTTDPGASLDDLQPVAAMIGEARIVGLGEATHGTEEFFRLKHRLVQLLASDDSPTVVALESSMADARAINQYLQDGDGDPAALLRQLGDWTWATHSFLDLVHWMRTQTASGRKSLRFWGFDVRSYDTAMQEVRAFVQTADPSYLDTLDAVYDELRAADKRLEIRASGRVTPQSVVRRWVMQAERVASHVNARRSHYLRNTSAVEVEWAAQCARLVVMYAQQYLNGGPSRDELMAENVSWILHHNQDAGRVLLWAHNDHVHRAEPSMGALLADRHGSDYRAVGFAFHGGRYRANGPRGRTDYPAASAPVGSLEDVLHRLNEPLFALDLPDAPASATAEKWLFAPVERREIGSFAAQWAFQRAPLADRFDVLVYVDVSSPPRPLDDGP